MKKKLSHNGLFVIAPLSFLCASGLLAHAAKDGWVPWRYTDFRVSAIAFRSRCVVDTDRGSSKWEYQFSSRADTPTDLVEREEHLNLDTHVNQLSPPEFVSLEAGALSPIFESEVNGTCANVKELNIEVICVIVRDQQTVNDPCFQGKNGNPIDPKAKPLNVRYK